VVLATGPTDEEEEEEESVQIWQSFSLYSPYRGSLTSDWPVIFTDTLWTHCGLPSIAQTFLWLLT